MLGSLCCAAKATEAQAKVGGITVEDCTKNGRTNIGQWQYIAATARFNVVVCSRRAGKSDGAVRRAARMVLGKPGARVCYITLIRRNCKKYFYRPLCELLRTKGVPFSSNESDLVIELANGSYVQAFSCMDASDVQTVLGDKWDLAIIDEAQSMRDEIIEELVDRALLPSLLDRRGSLDLLGTPPPGGQVGYFYDVFAANKFQRHRWTLFDNPWIPSDEIDELISARSLTKDHAIYQREFLGEFVVDPDSLVFEFDADRNAIPDDVVIRPENDRSIWRYSMGLDLGFQDRDAIVVLGWRKDDPKHSLYVCYTWQKNHQDIDDLAKVFVDAYHTWKPGSIVGDTGGHGAVKTLETLKNRLGGIKMLPKPTSLPDSIGLVNDELRTGRLQVPRNDVCVHDFKLTTWAYKKHGQEISDSYHSDILAALRYAVVAAKHYTGKSPPREETDDQRRDRRWEERQRAARNLYGYSA